jgi:chaperonin GroEL
MEYNNPSEIVKDLTFGKEASDAIIRGVGKLANAVSSTLGASGKCVIYEDALGKPIITKDGVTVAESVILIDPVENMGATLIKEAARNTVKQAGDGTTTATVLAHSLLEQLKESNIEFRELKSGVNSALDKVIKYIDSIKKDVTDDNLEDVATISTNNDRELGAIIAEAYRLVGRNGVVLMDESDTEKTHKVFEKGVSFDSGLKSQHLATNEENDKCELENPYILISKTPIESIRKIQGILEFVIKEKRPLLIVGEVGQQPMSALLMNKVKGNIKINIVDLPGFGPTKMDTLQDLAILTGAKLIDESLGDDMELMDPSVLGESLKSVTDSKSTVLKVDDDIFGLDDRIKSVEDKISKEENPFLKKKLEQRLSMLTGSLSTIKVGAQSKVELKEKKDRVEDAIYAVKAALQEGIVPGGGIALLDASSRIKASSDSESVLLESIKAPFHTILRNASMPLTDSFANKKAGFGVDVVTGKNVNMIKAGIIDPALVTKTALKNAVSVAITIVSADCIISNKRINDASYK